MNPLLSFLGFYESFFFLRGNIPFLPGCRNLGFRSVMQTAPNYTHWSRKHTAWKPDIFILSPFPTPFLSAPPPSQPINDHSHRWPAFQASHPPLTLMTLLDFAILLRVFFCAQLDHGRGQRSNGFRESFMKICFKPRMLAAAPRVSGQSHWKMSVKEFLTCRTKAKKQLQNFSI